MRGVGTMKGVLYNTTGPRIFNGKKFYWTDHFQSKSKALKEATSLRCKGLKVRVLKETKKIDGTWYSLWISS